MVGRHRKNRAVEQTAQFQLLKQFSDCRIFVGNGAIIRLGSIPALVWFGRSIGIVRIIEVYPNKKGALPMLVQPRHRTRHHFFSAAPNSMVEIFSSLPDVKAGIVGLKSPVKATGELSFRLEDDRTDKCGRVISVGAKNFRGIGQVRH